MPLNEWLRITLTDVGYYIQAVIFIATKNIIDGFFCSHFFALKSNRKLNRVNKKNEIQFNADTIEKPWNVLKTNKTVPTHTMAKADE